MAKKKCIGTQNKMSITETLKNDGLNSVSGTRGVEDPHLIGCWSLIVWYWRDRKQAKPSF